MRQLHQKQLLVIAGLLLMALTFQNFDFADGWRLNFGVIRENARQAHAKELLGKYYEGSFAQKVERNPALSLAIYNEVYRQLPDKYKNRAVEVAKTIMKESAVSNIDPVFVLAVIKTESSFNPLARGRFGEIGLMQIKPDTAKWIAHKYGIPWRGKKTLENPVSNVRIGVAYFNWLREKFDGSANRYISAYNMGARKVTILYSQAQKPKEYSLRVMKNYKETYARLAIATSASLLADNSL
jgi:soluble lytic murein transglycosylase